MLVRVWCTTAAAVSPVLYSHISVIELVRYLGGYEGKAGGDSSLEDTEKEPNCNGTGEVMHNSEEGEDEAPCDDTEGRVLGQGQSLQQDRGRIFPRQVSYGSQLSPYQHVIHNGYNLAR